MRTSSLSLSLSASEIINGEWRLVSRAGDHHPRNYYAWNHMRNIVDLVVTRCGLPVCTTLLSLLPGHVLAWCIKHSSDVSGWSFLLFLYRRVGAPKESEWLLKNAIDAALSFQWSGEAFWSFVKASLASDGVCGKKARTMTLLRLRKAVPDGRATSLDMPALKSAGHVNQAAQHKAAVRRAVSWIDKNWQPYDSGNDII